MGLLGNANIWQLYVRYQLFIFLHILLIKSWNMEIVVLRESEEWGPQLPSFQLGVPLNITYSHCNNSSETLP